ncbi:hypothetical protein BYT27DRAFT_7189311 [Phlegmacium glaucopus]|nr:hypothetical protein BYT27DRAFT_7189311 [Phlegmacium glaucopus]
MLWCTFICQNPDFAVRSLCDGTVFQVSKTAMQTSDIFKDMFTCCNTDTGDAEQVLDLQESSGNLIVLLRLLHDPPSPPAQKPLENTFDPIEYDPATIIPLPLLISVLFELADKYALQDTVMQCLKAHLVAHAAAHPLEVYGFATLHGMERVASHASQYVLPVASYTFDEINLIPNVVAYHKLVRLQDFRRKALRDLILGESIFPHGYGACSSHSEKTIASWDRLRKALEGRIESATDIAAEMGTLRDRVRDCKICHKACTAAVEMLAVRLSFQLFNA